MSLTWATNDKSVGSLNKRDTRSGEVWNLWYLLSLVRADPKEKSSTAEPGLLLKGPNLFYKQMKDMPIFFNSTKFVSKIKIAHTSQISRSTSKFIVSSSSCDRAVSVSLRSQLSRIPSSHVTIYLSKSVLTIFSKVSSHLKRGLVTPHCRDLLYSFKPKYSLSSPDASSCSIQR